MQNIRKIDFHQAHADIATLFSAAIRQFHYSDSPGSHSELEIQQAQMRLSTLLERVRILEQEVPRPIPRYYQGPDGNPCGEIVLDGPRRGAEFDIGYNHYDLSKNRPYREETE